MANKIDNILIDLPSTWLAVRRAAEQIRALCADGDGGLHETVKTALLASFTADPLADFAVVEAARQGIRLDCYVAGYGQFSQEVLDPASGLYRHAPEITFMLLEPQAMGLDPLEELNSLINAVKRNTAGRLAVGTFVNPPAWPLHVLPGDGEDKLHEINRRLKQELAADPQVRVLDLDRLAAWEGYAGALDPRMLAMARVPFSESFLALLARKMLSHIVAARGRGQKCLVLDCDNTLWGGIIGEDGMEGIRLGPDSPGREFVEFQRAILELYEQGVILAINSKNNPEDVMRVLREHPHMVLRERHFAAIVVNWMPKHENMQHLADEINIGLDSMVFADDNPAEREIIRQMLPQVRTLDLPANPALYARALRESSFFTRAVLTEEDRRRGEIYAAQRQRSELQKSVPTLADYLRSLEMIGTIRLAGESDIPRAAQLTQRTNQFNLTTRRYSEADIRRMLESSSWAVYVLGLRDRFGDNGTVGLALVEKAEAVWRIDTFLMSCRVIGRQAEDALVDRIARDAAAAGAGELRAEYIATRKNPLVADFWPRMGFEQTAAAGGTCTYRLTPADYAPKTFEYLKIE